MATAQKVARRGRPSPPVLRLPDVPYTMRLADGRTLYVEVPGRWTVTDRSGQLGFAPEAVRFLDRIRALAVRLTQSPSPGFITSLREAMGLTQQQFGSRIGVNKLTVSRWERGALRPGPKSIRSIDVLRHKTVHRGVFLAA